MPGTTINGSNNGPLRGSKRQTWEGGIRVPFIIRWKGHVPEGKTDARPIIQLDVLPTAARSPPAFHWKPITRGRRQPAAVYHRQESGIRARGALLAARRNDGDSQRRLEAREDTRGTLPPTRRS